MCVYGEIHPDTVGGEESVKDSNGDKSAKGDEIAEKLSKESTTTGKSTETTSSIEKSVDKITEKSSPSVLSTHQSGSTEADKKPDEDVSSEEESPEVYARQPRSRKPAVTPKPKDKD